MMRRRILTAREQHQMLAPWHQASAAQDEAEARGERLPPLPIRRQRIYDEHWMKKPWAEGETLLRPHGKNVPLYHRTTPEQADKLVEKGFKRKKNPDTKDVYFSDVLDDAKADYFGDAIVKVVLPHTVIGPGNSASQTIRHRRLDDPNDTDWHQDGPAENWYEIDSKHLKGVPVERIAGRLQRTAMPSRTVPVGTQGGLHTRPSSIVTDAVLHANMTGNPGKVTLTMEGQPPVDASSFMDVMSLGALRGTPITVSSDNEALMHQVADIVAHDHDTDKSYYNRFPPFSFDQLYNE